MNAELVNFEAKVQEQLEERARLVGGKPWGVKQGKPRIYLPSRRDVKVFVAFEGFPTGDDADLLGGAKLVVLIDDCGQHPNWYRAQREKIMSQHVELMERLAHLHTPPQEEALHGDPVTRQAAELLVVGQQVTLFYGGAPGEANAERRVSGVIDRVALVPDSPGTLDADADGQTCEVDLRLEDGGKVCLYTWRRLLRYGGGAEVVRM
jgi:hypothetical protein